MAKYSVKFKIEVIVDEPFIVGDVDDEISGKLTDRQWNEIVNDAMNIMEGIQNNVTEITRIEEDD